jgi:hypothetical protein
LVGKAADRIDVVAWTLEDAEARALQAPESFFIRSAELRHSLKVGDGVKLIFQLERDDGETSVERMWVEVVETGPYVGILRNVAELDAVIAPGERVTFGPEHVCGYTHSVAELGYDPDVPCFLLKRVGQADIPPPLLLRNEDGEWEAHGVEETDEELADSTNVLSWTLGYLTDRFPQTTQAIQDGS